MDANAHSLQFVTTETVLTKHVRDLLITAFEGGSNYWYRGLRCGELPAGTRKADLECWYAEVPLQEGGSVKFKDAYEPDTDLIDDDGYYSLTLVGVTRGLAIMRENHPRHWADFTQKNDDAITADVFLQCCIFGEIVYG